MVVLKTWPQKGALGSPRPDHLLAAEVGAGHHPLGRRREEQDRQVEQLADPQPGLGGGHRHRQELAGPGAGRQPAPQLLLVEGAGLEVAAQQLVVGLGGRLQQGGAERRGLGRQLGRHLGLGELAEGLGVDEVGLHGHQVDQPPAPGPGADGDLQDHRLHLERGLDVGQRLLEVGLLVVDAGDEAEGGDAGVGQHVVGPLGAVVAAVGRRDGHHRAVGHLQRPLHLGEEGGEPRAVEDVEAAAALLERLGVETEREVALLLLGLGVEPRRGAVGAGVAGIGEPEQRLHQGGLAGAVGAEHREGAGHPGGSHGLADSCPRAARELG